MHTETYAPRTMYKTDDIARAKENIQRHAWARKLYDGIKSSAAYYLAIDRNCLRSFIGDKTPLVTVKCPTCDCGPWYAYELIHNGDTLQCTDCRTTWDWDPNDTSETWNIHAVTRTYRLQYILNGLESAGLVYRIENDIRYAEKVAILVERFAEVFKHYRLNRVNQNEWHDINSPYYGKIDGWKRRDGTYLHKVLLAYDLVRDSGVLSDPQIQTIDRDLVAYARDYFVESFHSTGERTLEGYTYTPDLSPYLSHYAIQDHGESWWCIAASAAILDDHKTLQTIVTLFEDMLKPKAGVFFEDGVFYECAADYTIGLLQNIMGIPEIVRGNLDRDIYTNPNCALLERAFTWFLDAAFPNDTNPAINDSHVGSPLRPFCSEIAAINYNNPQALHHLKQLYGPDLNGGTAYSLFYRNPDAANLNTDEPYATESKHLPGMGLMILRHGEPRSKQTMAYLDYGPYIPAAHKQKDYLNIGLWACGLEMVPENGYNWNPEWARLWERSATSHNTVLECAEQGEGGKPLLWHITPGPKIAEAGLPPANTRFLALLPRQNGKPLIAEIFRVSGSLKTYTWMLHARSGQFDLHGVETFSPADVPAPLRNGQAGPASGELTATWTFPENRGLHLVLPGLTPSTVTRCECPPEEDIIADLHEKGGTLKPGATLPYRAHLQVTRSGPEAIFAAVHCPFEGTTPPDLSITAQQIGPALGLHIHCGDEQFLVLHNPDASTATFEHLELTGRAAVATIQNDKLTSLVLAGGTVARYHNVKVEGDAERNGYYG